MEHSKSGENDNDALLPLRCSASSLVSEGTSLPSSTEASLGSSAAKLILELEAEGYPLSLDFYQSSLFTALRRQIVAMAMQKKRKGVGYVQSVSAHALLELECVFAQADILLFERLMHKDVLSKTSDAAAPQSGSNSSESN